jgi:RHS repeat-associated protein
VAESEWSLTRTRSRPSWRSKAEVGDGPLDRPAAHAGAELAEPFTVRLVGHRQREQVAGDVAGLQALSYRVGAPTWSRRNPTASFAGPSTPRSPYLVNCYYDPSTGQFLTVDPLVDQTGQPYAYVEGNPITTTDPTGADVPQDLAPAVQPGYSGRCSRPNIRRRPPTRPGLGSGRSRSSR